MTWFCLGKRDSINRAACYIRSLHASQLRPKITGTEILPTQQRQVKGREQMKRNSSFPFYSLGCLLYIPAVSYMNAVLHLSVLFNFPKPVTMLYRANSVVCYSAKALLYNPALLYLLLAFWAYYSSLKVQLFICILLNPNRFTNLWNNWQKHP